MCGMRIAGSVCGAFLLVLVAACSHQIPLNPTFQPSSAVHPINEPVGVYFSDEFKKFEYRGSFGGDSWIYPLGPASTRLFTRVFDQVFQKTSRVDALPPLGPEHAELTAVIEPRIEEFDFHIPLLKTQTYTASIAYRFILHDAKGEPVASWVVRGEGSKAGEFGFEFARWPGQAADLAIEEAARKFSEGILREPEVRHWLKRKERLISSLAGAAHREGGESK